MLNWIDRRDHGEVYISLHFPTLFPTLQLSSASISIRLSPEIYMFTFQQLSFFFKIKQNEITAQDAENKNALIAKSKNGAKSCCQNQNRVWSIC